VDILPSYHISIATTQQYLFCWLGMLKVLHILFPEGFLGKLFCMFSILSKLKEKPYDLTNIDAPYINHDES